MENSEVSQEGSIDLYFVLPQDQTPTTCSPILRAAYEVNKENGFNPQWLSTEDCLGLSPTKTDVFVCDPFDSPAFKHLTTGFKCTRVVGARCILSCLQRKEPLPELPSPIHNTAMRGLVLTSTGFSREEKEELQTLLQRMAGVYSNIFNENVTHVLAKVVGSKKCLVAVEREKPIMTGEWVKAVWEAVLAQPDQHVCATDHQFHCYACPTFKGLEICVSQLNKQEKEALKNIIQENGGTYSASLHMSATSVLIVPSPGGDKYNHAKNWKIECLTPDWIYDSVERGTALTMEGYRVQQRGASTPTKDNPPNQTMPPDVSMCSTILNDDESMLHKVSHINETVVDGNMSIMMKKEVLSPEETRALAAVEELDLQEVLKVGQFLDGCKIFLSGFSSAQMEKLRRVLNAGGATRLNQLTDALSHVIVGKVVKEHLNTVRSMPHKPHVLYAHWFTESLRLRRPAEEAPFTLALEGEQKPVVSAVAPENVQTATSRLGDSTVVDEEVLHQYLQPNTSTSRPANLNDTTTSLADGL